MTKDVEKFPTKTCRVSGRDLKSTVPEDVVDICKKLQTNNKQCYVVGGATRDLMMGKDPHDWDLTTDATPDEMEEIFSDEKILPTGIKQGTETIFRDGEGYELTTYRIEGPYSDKIRPDFVDYADNLHDDLVRRDLTINAIAYDPLSREIVTTPNDGIHDLKDKIIRAPGNPEERITEHPIRMMRACRFKSRLNFDIDPELERAITKKSRAIHTQPEEAVAKEINKILTQSEKPSVGIECLRETGLLKEIMPEFKYTIGMQQPGEYHEHDVYNHILHVLDETPNDLHVRLAALFHDIGKPSSKKWSDKKSRYMFSGHEDVSAEIAEQVMKRLKYSNKDIKRVQNLVENHMVNYSSNWSDKAIRRFINRVGEENVDELMELHKADIIGSGKKISEGLSRRQELMDRIEKIESEYGQKTFTKSDLKVDGHDIMDYMNIDPGPEISDVKNYLFDKVLENPELNNKDDLYKLMSDIKCTKK